MTPKAIEITLRTLLRSPNPAATGVLLDALEAEESAWRVGAARVLASREDVNGHRALVERFARLPQEVRTALAISGPRTPWVGSLAGMISPGTPRLARRVAEVARQLGLVSLAPRLVEAVEWSGQSAPVFAECVLSLAGSIERAIRQYPASVSGGSAPKPDPAFDRRATLNALGPAIDRFGQHQRPELIESFLLLAPSDDPLLQRLIRSPKDPAYDPLLRSLRTSHTPGALAVLSAALADPRAPTELVSLAAERHTAEDLEQMFTRLGPRLGLRARENCRRIGGFAWLDPERVAVLASLSDPAQAVAVQLAACSSANRSRVVGAIRLVLSFGQAFGCLAAVRAIEDLPPPLATAPLREALACGDPAVLAEVIPLLRLKEFPNATAALVPMLGHDDQRVRRAAGRSLSELSFMSYRDQRHNLSREERRRVGQLVNRADPMTRSVLLAELRSGAPGRRIDALALIEEMGLVDSFAENLVRLLRDRDSGVRGEVVRLLGTLAPTHQILKALAEATTDQTPAVSRAAKSSYLRLGGDVALAMKGTAQASFV